MAETGRLFESIAFCCFTVGTTGFLSCGDHAQTSLKTVTLMALATIIAVPLYSDYIGQIAFYILLVLLWCYTLYLICKKDSVLNQTYDKKLDSFPHWLLCLVPAVAATVCICMFLKYDDGSFAFCQVYYKDTPKFCTFLWLHLLSALLYAVAFIPQVYIVFKVWAGHARESAGLERKVYFKVKLFLAFMFAFFVSRGLVWVLIAASNQAVDTDYLLVFFCADVIGALVTVSPWICRATCMHCCGCTTTCGCCIKKPPEEEQLGADANRDVNTAQSNHNALAEEEERKNSGSIMSSWFSSFSKETKTTENKLRDEEREVGVDMPELSISSATDGETLGSSPTRTTCSTNSSNSRIVNLTTAPYVAETCSHSNAYAARDDRAEWLQD